MLVATDDLHTIQISAATETLTMPVLHLGNILATTIDFLRATRRILEGYQD
ncbi:hypothetical protein CFII68_20168 [Pseudomonas sp. CFII68]|nr:hypothetical protein CFII68_20168 [Pseudomonas sp. CFII68]